MKILLVDDHAVVRRGIRQILEDDLRTADFGEAANTDEALARIAERDWDIVVLDISMPGRGGLDTLKDIRALKPGLPVLVLSMHAEEQYAVRAHRAGANGYLTKDSAPAALVEAVRTVAGGGRSWSSAVAEKLEATRPAEESRPLHESLSDREFQVLRMIAAGKAVKEIAFELQLSEKTIATHRTRILEKMGMKSSAELTRYALSAGLVE
jgi:two-component system, NarL family, invasion response regulator UvrY